MTTLYSHTIRLLTCRACGAPIDAAVSGGEVRCPYCDTTNVLQHRDEAADRERARRGMAAAISESERFAQLRRQDQGVEALPESLAAMVEGSMLRYSAVDAAREEWKVARRQLAEGAGFGVAERFFYLTILLTEHLGEREQRAALETAAELLTDERHRHVVRCMLARMAAQHGDPASAEEWLETCNPRPTDLIMDTAYRFAAATSAAARNDTGRMLEVLGHRSGDVPFADREQLGCELLRVHAIELGGDARQALSEMQALGARYGLDAIERRLRAFEPMRVCPDAFGRAGAAQSDAENDARLRAAVREREKLALGLPAMTSIIRGIPFLALVMMLPVSVVRCSADADMLMGVYGVPLCPQVCADCEGPTRTVTIWTPSGPGEWTSDGAQYFCQTAKYPLGEWDSAAIEGAAYQMRDNEMGFLAANGATYLVLLMLASLLVPIRGYQRHTKNAARAERLDAQIRDLSQRLGRAPPHVWPSVGAKHLLLAIGWAGGTALLAILGIALSLST